jgi:hypothetical protein
VPVAALGHTAPAAGEAAGKIDEEPRALGIGALFHALGIRRSEQFDRVAGNSPEDFVNPTGT